MTLYKILKKDDRVEDKYRYIRLVFMLISLEYIMLYADYHWNMILAYLLIALAIYVIAKSTKDIRLLVYILVCRILGIGLSYILNMMLNHPDNWDDYFKPLGSGRNTLIIGMISLVIILFRSIKTIKKSRE